jgi:hypothetical protein
MTISAVQGVEAGEKELLAWPKNWVVAENQGAKSGISKKVFH